MISNRKFKFTKKKTPKKGIMSFVLGLIAVVSEILTIYLSYTLKGDAPAQYGMVMLLSAIFAVAGLVLGILSSVQKDIYRFFPTLGIVFNTVAVGMIGFIIYVGI